MKCPFCGHLHDKVVDSRESKEGDAIRRRRQCLACQRRFTSYERIDEIPYMVVKKKGRGDGLIRKRVLGGAWRGWGMGRVWLGMWERAAATAERWIKDS